MSGTCTLEALVELTQIFIRQFAYHNFELFTDTASGKKQLQHKNYDMLVSLPRDGGHCLMNNQVFSHRLQEAGYHVRRIPALFGQMTHPEPRYNHLVLVVKIDDQQYLIDVGFGRLTLPRPLPLQQGVWVQYGPDSYCLREEAQYWRLYNKLGDKEIACFYLPQSYLFSDKNLPSVNTLRDNLYLEPLIKIMNGYIKACIFDEHGTRHMINANRGEPVEYATKDPTGKIETTQLESWEQFADICRAVFHIEPPQSLAQYFKLPALPKTTTPFQETLQKLPSTPPNPLDPSLT